MNAYNVASVRRLLSNIISYHEILSHDETISPQDFLRDIEQPLLRFINGKRENKVQLTLTCEMERVDLSTGEISETTEAHFRTLQTPVHGATDLQAMYGPMKEKMLEALTGYLKNGSGWRLKKVLRLTIKLSRNRPLGGSSYLPHPKGFNTSSLINIENKKDDLCFAWSILRLKYPIADKKNGNPKYIKDLKEHFNEFNWDGIEFPTPCCKRAFKKFENNNNVSVAVYGHEIYTELVKGEEVEKRRIIPLYVPTERRGTIYQLFFYKNEDGTNWHYNPITSLAGLVSKQVKNHHKGRGIFICDYCLNYFGTQRLLDNHEEICSQHKAVKTIYPEPGKNDILRFKNIQNCIECPIKFYIDTESILQPVDETHGKTKLFQRHKTSAFYIYPVLRIGDESVTIEPVEAIGNNETDDIAKILGEKLEEKAKEVYERFNVPVKMIFDETARISFESARNCYACGQKLNDDKVRDHDHFTGKYRGALHSECNLKLRQKPFSIPVFAHNMSGYDSHMFVRLLGETEDEVSCIPQNEEKYMSFRKNVIVDVVDGKNVYVTLNFKDTFRFLGKSLAGLVKITETFRHTDKYFSKEEQKVLRSKQHYPYEYMDSFLRFEETTVPLKEAFNSSLNLKGLVFSSRTDNLSELKPEEMSDKDYEDFKRSWEASKSKNLGDFTMLYVKGDTLQLADVFENFIDVFMDLFNLDPSHYISAPHYFNDAMLMVTGVQIPLLTDADMHLFFEDSKRGGVSLAMKRYAKANNKYMENYDPEKPSKYIIYNDKNGLYTSILAGLLPFSDFKWITEEEKDEVMSAYEEGDYDRIKPGSYRVNLTYPKELHDVHNAYPLAVESVTVDRVKKLVPNLNDKVRYVAHHEELKMYLKHGLVLKKVHEGISYTEKAFMKKFIDIINKPIQHRVSVLGRAKVPMYDWHYEYMLPKYGNKAKLCYTDTDSLIYEIETEDYYNDIRADVPTKFDTSDYPVDHPSGLPIMNKKVPGMMKDEAKGKNVVRAVFLGPKQYALETEHGDNEIKDKGVPKVVLKNTLTVDHYEDCLKNDTTYYAKFNILRSRKHDVTTETVTKVALTSADNKRIIIPNDSDHNTLAPGHWRAKDSSLYDIDFDTKKLFTANSLMNLAYNALR